ncbi:MAG: hypothetical protein AABX05_03720 [Nanoarchaeota archaeon]
MTYITQEGLKDFLKESIDHSLARHKVDLSALAQEHVVAMLKEFSESEHLFVRSESGSARNVLEPITFQYQQIHEQASFLARLEKQQQLGDHCLFLVGYFYDFVRRDGKSMIRYHARIGASAYEKTGIPPFTEMAKKFSDLCFVISDLHLPQLDEEGLMQVYNRWIITGDKYYKSLLTGKGINPVKVKGIN